MSKVTVYRYRGYNSAENDIQQAKSMATEEAIKQLGCAKIEGSGLEIDESELDGNGIYKIKGYP